MDPSDARNALKGKAPARVLSAPSAVIAVRAIYCKAYVAGCFAAPNSLISECVLKNLKSNKTIDSVLVLRSPRIRE